MNLPTIGINALYWRPDRMGGTQTYLLRLLDALARRGRFRYVAFVGAAGADQLAALCPGIKVVAAPGYCEAPIARMLWENAALPHLVREARIDLLHSLGYLCPPGVGCPQVVTVHDLVHYRWPQTIDGAKRALWQVLFPTSLRTADRIITVSKAVGEEVRLAFPYCAAKLTFVHLGADHCVQPAATAPLSDSTGQAPYVLAVGSAAKHKNFAVVIKALRLLSATCPDLRLVIVGMRTATTSNLESLVRKLGVTANVDFTGRIGDDAVARLYRGACAFVFPSLYEGFGLPLVEAMSVGCPVVAADIPVTREVVGDAAVLFDGNSEHALAAALRSIVTNDAAAAVLRARGAEQARRYRWDLTAAGTEAVYADVLHESDALPCASDRVFYRQW